MLFTHVSFITGHTCLFFTNNRPFFSICLVVSLESTPGFSPTTSYQSVYHGTLLFPAWHFCFSVCLLLSPSIASSLFQPGLQLTFYESFHHRFSSSLRTDSRNTWPAKFYLNIAVFVRSFHYFFGFLGFVRSNELMSVIFQAHILPRGIVWCHIVYYTLCLLIRGNAVLV